MAPRAMAAWIAQATPPSRYAASRIAVASQYHHLMPVNRDWPISLVRSLRTKFASRGEFAHEGRRLRAGIRLPCFGVVSREEVPRPVVTTLGNRGGRGVHHQS